MNCNKAVRDYITKMITDTPGMKVMLLDAETTPIVSMVYAQSEILQKEVYLLERIEQPAREVMTHLKAIVFVRPTAESIDAVVKELKRPKYGQYDIYLSNILQPSQLERLAEADEHEVVREVQEFFADYLAIGPHLTTFNLPSCVGGDNADPRRWDRDAFKRCHEGLLAQLLSLKKKPVVRYQESSPQCKKLADELCSSMLRESSLFDFRVSTDVPAILLIIDRRDDPITPLLNQWTYQAMVHERLGIKNNRVDMSKVEGIAPEMHQIVLSSEQDEFYRKKMYGDFGEIGDAIKLLVQEFQMKSKKNEKLDTIEDMKAFVENYPQFRAMSGSVSKHVAVVGELSRIADKCDLFTLGECEQDLVVDGKHDDMVLSIKSILSSKKSKEHDAERLLFLYALRYGRTKDLEGFLDILEADGVKYSREKVSRLLDYAGQKATGRSSDLFGAKGLGGMIKKMKGSLKGVVNIFTQHTPLLAQTLEQLAKGKLKEAAFPFVERPYHDKPQDVIVFMVGGCTYAESRVVAQFNENNPTMRVILGGSAVHNSESFLEEMKLATAPRKR